VQDITSIAIPTRPQSDTIVAIYLLKEYGKERFPGVEHAPTTLRATLLPGDTFESMCAEGTLALDMGEGPLDHHFKNHCTSELVAKYLHIEQDPSIAQMLTWARRDDKEGKGTLSRDAIDRAFGLAGLISALNKAHPQDPNAVISAVLPLLAAHHRSAREHHIELPKEVEAKKQSGHYEEFEIVQNGKTFKLACVVSDKPSMPTFLRSEKGGKADAVLQKLEASNHYCVLTNQKSRVDLSKVAGLIRMREAQLNNILVPEDDRYVTQIGRIDEVPNWYFDPMTNSLLNGGAHNREVPESEIPHEEMKEIVKAGLNLGGK
jgi:hypothetical protein